MRQDLRYLTIKGGFFETQTTFDIYGDNAEKKSAGIIYGKNGSGKTTISNMINNLKNSQIDDYDEILLLDKDKNQITENDLNSKIFVYNESFIDDNIKLTTSTGLDT